MRISTGERTLMRQNSERISGWVFDLEGQLRLAARTAENGDTEILRADAAGFTKVYSCSVLETCGVDRFHKDGQHVYMETNKGDGVDLARLVLFDPASGREELVESDPLGRVGFGFASFSEATDELVATGYQDERRRMYFRDKAVEADYKHLGLAVRGKDVRVSSATADDQLWLVTAQSDREPGETYLFDRRTKKLALQYRIRERIPRGDLAAVKPIRYLSSDGLVIPAYLTLPKGVLARRLPLIALPHGGPWGRDSWSYDGMAQFLANRGYAVLQPNFRSSTGYGKKFLNAGNMAFFAAAEKFLGTYLHSRFQEGATPEVAARLKEITVDPKTVVLTPKVEPTAVGLPAPAADLAPSTANYQGKVEAGGQTMPISITSTIKEEGDTWAVTAAAKLPMGEMVDTVWVRKGGLAVVKRSVRQGPVAIDVAFKDGKAEGSMTMSGQSRPINVDCGGPLFADGAAAADTIAALPLADGFTTTFRNLDLQRQKVALKRLSVKGCEDVTVPAGTFKAWKVEVVSAEGEAGQATLWVTGEPRLGVAQHLAAVLLSIRPRAKGLHDQGLGCSGFHGGAGTRRGAPADIRVGCASKRVRRSDPSGRK